jgi:hypothetical protein
LFVYKTLKAPHKVGSKKYYSPTDCGEPKEPDKTGSFL